MKARLTISNIRNFRLLVLLLFVFCLAFVFAPNTYADDRIDYSSTRLYISYTWFKYSSNSGRWSSAGSDTSVYAEAQYNSDTGYYEWSLDTGTQPTTCNNNCYLYVYNIQVTPRILTGSGISLPDSSGTDYTHIYLFSEYAFATGNYGNQISYHNIWYLTPMGKDAWIPAAASNHDSCDAQGESNCKIDFWADSVPEYQDENNPYNNFFYGISLDIKNSVFPSYTPYPLVAIVQNPYNLNNHNFDTLNSFLYWIPDNSESHIINFYGKVWGDNNFSNGISSDTEINLEEASPDFDIEYRLINQNTNSATTSVNGLDINFSVPWVFQAWFSLFVDSTCVDIPIIQGMIHSSESVVCTPWSSSLRSTLTPIFSILSSMLAFAFVIRWLSKDSSKEAEIYG